MSLPLASKGIEHLSAAQREVVERFLSDSKIDGVVTGVLVGAAAWDLRPLIMEGGRLELIRPIPPELVQDPALDRIIKGLDTARKRIDPSFLPLEIKRVGTVAWLRRAFPAQVLSEVVNPFAQNALEVEAYAVRDLLQFLSELYSAGICHGNIALSNIGYVQGKLLPLDVALHAITHERSGEVSADKDLANLSKIFSLFKFRGCSPALVAELKLLGAEPGNGVLALRRAISQFPKEKARPVEPEPSADTGVSASMNRRGKLIDARVVAKQEIVEEREEDFEPRPMPRLERGHLMLFGLILGVVLAAIYAYRNGNSFFTHRSPAEYAELWNSNQAEQIKEVVNDALSDPFSDALETIRRETFADHKPTSVRSEIIKVAFDQQWFSALNENDRRAALYFALGDLLPASQRKAAPLQNLHPGVLLAIAGMVTLESPGDMFANIPLSRFLTLPKPIAEIFQLFLDSKLTSLRDLPPRAFAHLYMGDGSPQAFQNYFVKASNADLVRTQVRALLPLLVKYPDFSKEMLNYMSTAGVSIVSQLGWFEGEQTARWGEADPIVRLALLSGVLPPIDLSLEQYIDLLQFPQPEIRLATQMMLTKRFISESYRSLLIVLASAENKLSRGQMVFLVSALQLPDDEAFAFFARWFNGEPDPDTVFLILLARSRSAKAAPFDVEAARYLIDRRWSASVEELAELVNHPEPLARALAYSRLDPKRPGDLQVLKAQLERETSERMRVQIKEKLAGAGK